MVLRMRYKSKQNENFVKTLQKILKIKTVAGNIENLIFMRFNENYHRRHIEPND